MCLNVLQKILYVGSEDRFGHTDMHLLNTGCLLKMGPSNQVSLYLMGLFYHWAEKIVFNSHQLT